MSTGEASDFPVNLKSDVLGTGTPPEKGTFNENSMAPGPENQTPGFEQIPGEKITHHQLLRNRNTAADAVQTQVPVAQAPASSPIQSPSYDELKRQFEREVLSEPDKRSDLLGMEFAEFLETSFKDKNVDDKKRLLDNMEQLGREHFGKIKNKSDFTQAFFLRCILKGQCLDFKKLRSVFLPLQRDVFLPQKRATNGKPYSQK